MQNQLLGGRYRLVRQLGQGGMGHVWEARDEALDRIVAVKVFSLLAGGGISGDEARARFLREARITARLQHPGIVTIHDLGETGPPDNRVPFLVMELVRGESLDVIMRRGGVTLTDAARWGAQICDALADAHDAGIMHRDIKPSNILITLSGTLRVLDFGIARAADPYAGRDRVTETGAILGTPSYMAPEQARGFAEPRSDLYALGCLLFELVTGRLPLQAPDSLGYLAAHLTDAPPAPSSVRAGIPPVWDELLLTLLRKDPAQRHRDARELAKALRQLDGAAGAVLAEVPPPADEDGPPTEPETVLLGSGGSGSASAASANGPLARTGSSSHSPAHRTDMPPSVEYLTRFGLPACLAAQYALLAPLELMTLETVGRPVLLAALVVSWALTAVLTPRTGGLTRDAGYAATVLVATGLVTDAVQKGGGRHDGFLPGAPVASQLLFDAGLVLTVAAYVYRDLATRRARAERDAAT